MRSRRFACDECVMDGILHRVRSAAAEVVADERFRFELPEDSGKRRHVEMDLGQFQPVLAGAVIEPGDPLGPLDVGVVGDIREPAALAVAQEILHRDRGLQGGLRVDEGDGYAGRSPMQNEPY